MFYNIFDFPFGVVFKQHILIFSLALSEIMNFSSSEGCLLTLIPYQACIHVQNVYTLSRQKFVLMNTMHESMKEQSSRDVQYVRKFLEAKVTFGTTSKQCMKLKVSLAVNVITLARQSKAFRDIQGFTTKTKSLHVNFVILELDISLQ